MKLSEFRRAIADEFGVGYSAVLARDVAIAELGNRTADEALAAGTPARDVWIALCRVQDVPQSRWRGAGRPEPKNV